ncbi:MAG: hypothetical protein QF830_02380 [Rhodospirillales bacterium]|jgi:hypothetical protein|nr:hypothetical protein [Rhodospirillales bacterium]MDP6882960.1 hypothetical protein [Rhodospirillales bacterium]
MSGEQAETSGGKNRGVLFGLFGVILIILGGLNTMLSWRGGFAILPFHTMLIGAGLLLCVVGAIRRHGRF